MPVCIPINISPSAPDSHSKMLLYKYGFEVAAIFEFEKDTFRLILSVVFRP
jgi:hypothetical protein